MLYYIRFFICVNGAPVPRQCVGELHFNEAIGQCDVPASANCPINGPENPGPPFNCEAAVAGAPPGRLPIFPHPTSCSQFVICAAGQPNFRPCAPGLRFDTVSQQCDLPGSVQCPPGTS